VIRYMRQISPRMYHRPKLRGACCASGMGASSPGLSAYELFFVDANGLLPLGAIMRA
jgi:hypothetical protein